MEQKFTFEEIQKDAISGNYSTFKGYPPFDATDLNRIGQGKESVVFSAKINGQKDLWVLKHATDLVGIDAYFANLLYPGISQVNRRLLTSQIRKRDFDLMKRYLGENLLDTHFVIGHSQLDGEQTCIRVQRFIQGWSFSEIKKTGRKYLYDKYPEIKSQLEKIVWGSKKIFQEVGFPPDIKFDNIMLEAESRKLFFSDCGIPSFYNLILESKKCTLLKLAAIYKGGIKKIGYLEKVESELDISHKQRSELDSRFGIDHANLDRRIANIRFGWQTLINQKQVFQANI
jgi:hypothetical protein